MNVGFNLLLAHAISSVFSRFVRMRLKFANIFSRADFFRGPILFPRRFFSRADFCRAPNFSRADFHSGAVFFTGRFFTGRFFCSRADLFLHTDFSRRKKLYTNSRSTAPAAVTGNNNIKCLMSNVQFPISTSQFPISNSHFKI